MSLTLSDVLYNFMSVQRYIYSPGFFFICITRSEHANSLQDDRARFCIKEVKLKPCEKRKKIKKGINNINVLYNVEKKYSTIDFRVLYAHRSQVPKLNEYSTS